jgi:hypothetical protein
MKPKAVVFTLLSVSLSIIAGLGLVEVILRIVGPGYYQFNNRSHEYFSNPRGYFDPLRVEGGHQIYGLEYKETEEDYRAGSEPAAGRPLLLGLGDSFTYGRGVRPEHTYLVRLQQRFNRENVPIAVKNAARVGADVYEVAGQYEYEAARQKPELVVYGFVLNDFRLPTSRRIVGSDYVDQNNGGYMYDPWRRYSAIYNYALFLRDRRRLETETLDNYLRAYEGPSATKGFATLEALDKAVSSDGGRLVILLFPLLYEFDRYPFASIHAKIEEFARTRNILFLDLLPAMSARDPEDLWAHPIDHHPNDVAHEIAAEALNAFLKARGVLDEVAARAAPHPALTSKNAGR